MKRILLQLLAVFGVALALAATPASAQATRTWISGVGDDVNPCSRTAPCKTFAGAISKTAASGEINVLDPGPFGTVTITKSITLRSDHVEAGLLASSVTGVIINAGPNDQIILDGLDIYAPTAFPGVNGVNIIHAGDVLIHNCKIHGFAAGGAGNGVFIQNTVDNMRVALDNDVIDHNSNGVVVASAAGLGHVKIFNSLFWQNSGNGISVSGAGNDAIVYATKVLSSAKALDIQPGGVIKSYGNNVFVGGDAPTLVPQN